MAEDAEARKMAALANQKIDSHEDRCSERWGEARDQMRRLHDAIGGLDEKFGGSLDKVHSRINALYKVILVTALGLAGFALVQWFLARGIAG